VIIGARAASAVEVDVEGRESSTLLCGDQPARLVRGSSATNHCHAAPALLTREYQSDDRRCSLTSAALPALPYLTKTSISEAGLVLVVAERLPHTVVAVDECAFLLVVHGEGLC
jgi:hypothetical protein